MKRDRDVEDWRGEVEKQQNEGVTYYKVITIYFNIIPNLNKQHLT